VWRFPAGAVTFVVLLRASEALAASTAPAVGDVVFRGPALAVRTLDLPSGMRIVLEVDHSQPVVGIASVVDCGSVQDPVGQEGLAHLIEHLTFRAKPDGKLQLSTSFDFAGAGTCNASTDYDLTTYFEIGPRESLSALLQLEGTRLARPLAGIDQEVFDAEREVVRNELLQLDDNGQVSAAMVALRAALYPAGHPYARPLIGTQASLWSLKLADAEAFVRRCYQPQNYTVVISGDFDATLVGARLDATFPADFLRAPPGGAVPIRSRLETVAPSPADPPPEHGARWVKAPADSPKLYFGWALPRGFASDGYLQAFLARALHSVATDATADSDIVSIQTSLDRGRFGSTLFLVAVLRTGSDPEGSAAKILRVLPVLEHLSNSWFERSRASAVVDLARSSDTLEERLTTGAQLVHLTGDPLTFRSELSAIEKLQRNQLEALAWTWLRAGRARVIFLKPDDGEIAGREVGGSPQVFAPSDDLPMQLAPSALATYVHSPAATMKSVALDTGLEVVLVQRQGATASVTIAVKSGTATATPFGAAGVADALSVHVGGPDASLWGIGLWSSLELDASFVGAVSAAGNVENALAVAAGRVTGLRLFEPLPKSWDRDVLPVFAEFEQKSFQRAERALFESTFAESTYSRKPMAADYKKLSAGDVKGWMERAYRPQNAIAVVVSDLDLAESERLARVAFAGWKGSSASPNAPFVAPVMNSGPIRTFHIERPGAKQTKLLLGCAAQPKDARDAVALELLGARLRSRLLSFARGRSAGTYSVVVNTKISRPLSNIKVSTFIDDRNLIRVVALARKELNELSDLRVSKEDLDGLKWRLGTSSTVNYGGSVELGELLAEIRAAELPLEFVTKFPELLQAVTAEDLARLAASCRQTATLGLVGDPAIVAKTFRATQLAETPKPVQ
jgi:zinc protease